MTKVIEWSHMVTSHSHSMWQRSQQMDMRTVGDKVHSHNSNCIYSVENPTGTLSSSLCQILNKETVGLILVIGLWLLILNQLTKKDHPFNWTNNQQSAFEELKEQFTSQPILTMPDTAKSFLLKTDASNFATGAVLMQRNNLGWSYPISFLS